MVLTCEKSHSYSLVDERPVYHVLDLIRKSTCYKDDSEHLHSPVQSCLKFSAVLTERYGAAHMSSRQMPKTYFGTISLKSSILTRPAGVSPIFMSMKTIGRVVEDILRLCWMLSERSRRHYVIVFLIQVVKRD